MKSAFGLLFCCVPLLASAQIYRWVDASGQVHFGQNPPASGPYKDVTPTLSDRAPQSKTGLSEGGDRQALKFKADNAERCAKARERISFLEQKTAGRLSRTGEDGQAAPLSQAEFDQQLKDARDAGSKYCS